MKKYNFILLLLVFVLFCSGSCEYREGRCFIIQNNSEQEIIVLCSEYRLSPMCFFKANETKQEYENFIHYKAIKPHSSKDIIGLRYLDSQDTVFIHIFNRIDMDTMSCEEFKQKHPLKYEWKKVTVTDMEACDWTLEYP